MTQRKTWLLVSLATLLVTEAQSQEWKTDSAIVMLHRSANCVAPENTVAAFEGAYRQGADGIETDIRKTRDGVFVIYHDDWVLMQRGPAGKIEEMTLAETQHLDLGERFGKRWRGVHPPLFEDLLRFIKANDLRIYLDIKSVGIYDEVMRIVEAQGCLGLVHASGGQVPEKHYFLPISWVRGWNYTDGGEEDPARMRSVIAGAQSGVYGIMCDDARAIVRALGRRPELRRPLAPFVSTVRERLALAARDGRNKRVTATESNPRDLLISNVAKRRAACFALSRKPVPWFLEELLALAETDPDYGVRQDACWALGSLKDDRAIGTLLRTAKTAYDPKTAGTTEYRDFFLKTAAGCALARLNSVRGRRALHALLESPSPFDRQAAGIGIAVFGTAQDIPVMVGLLRSLQKEDAFVADFVVGYAARFGKKAMPLYLAALSRDGDTAKFAVFGLEGLGPSVVPALRKRMEDRAESAAVRRRAALAIDWISEERATIAVNGRGK